MKRKWSALAVFMLLAAGSLAAADLPPGKWWRRPEVAKQINLTEDQKSKLDQVFNGAAPELIDLRADVEKQNLALRNELDVATPSKQNVMKAADRVNIARGRLFARELALLVDLRGVLSAEQWNKLRSELDRRDEMQGGRGGRGGQMRRDGQGGRGPGGPMGGPPPMDGGPGGPRPPQQ